MSTSRSQVPSAEPRAPRLSFLLLLNALALVLVAVWFRGESLENIPGINGDEAWYGVQAWQMLHGGADGGWHTPTGNPINPLFLGPVALLLCWLPPSITVLRSVALASGLAALAINWFCCRWVFDRRTAWISTAALAVLPINIAYSRFAWDASQSLAATLPVAYFTLAAVRFPHHFGRWMAAAVLALAIAVWVHPTNIFAGAAIAIALARRYRLARTDASLARISCVAMLLAAALLIAVWVWAARPGHGPLPGRMERWWGNVLDLPHAAVLFPRLFSGGTIYRDISGSQSWFEWPLPAGCDGAGLDVGLFWAIIFGSAWMLYRSRLRLRTDRDDRLRFRAADGVLLAAWTLEFAAFQLVAGVGGHGAGPGAVRHLPHRTDRAARRPRGRLGVGSGLDALARCVGAGRVGRLACAGRLSRAVLPFHRTDRRPGTPHVPHRSDRA